MPERSSAAPGPSPGSVVSHESWEREDLSGRTFDQVSFLDVDLTEVTAHGATFDGCTFHDVDLNATRFSDTAFLNCTFSRSSFFGARFEGCKLTGSTFDRCRFGALEVTRGDLAFVGLSGADLRKAVFRRVRMREADLSGARLAGAVLHHVDLSGASLHRTDLTGADLRGSDLSAVDPLTNRLAKAVVDLDQAVVLVQALGVVVSPDLPPEDE